MNTHQMDIEDVLKEIKKFGFRQVLDIPFDAEGKHEHFYVYFHYTYGILLQFDTYNGRGVNGGQYYYQWTPIGDAKHHSSLSSGGWTKINDQWFWNGYGDCREGMFESIKALTHDGTFITPWIVLDKIFIPTLVHYGDHRTDYSAAWDEGYKLYKAALRTKTPERFRMLPLLVQKAIRNGMNYAEL